MKRILCVRYVSFQIEIRPNWRRKTASSESKLVLHIIIITHRRGTCGLTVKVSKARNNSKLKIIRLSPSVINNNKKRERERERGGGEGEGGRPMYCGS